MSNRRIQRFDGPLALQELLRQMKMDFGDRPKVRVIGKSTLGESFILENVVVRNHVLMHPDKPGGHSIFHLTDLSKSKRGRPIPQRVAWPPENIPCDAVNLHLLVAVEIY
ncbi:MAG: hypothetical protein WC831_02790 [Parcubacteria group bacterium]|jgi:hypothetical protein